MSKFKPQNKFYPAYSVYQSSEVRVCFPQTFVPRLLEKRYIAILNELWKKAILKNLLKAKDLKMSD
jgi:hypothetical protein